MRHEPIISLAFHSTRIIHSLVLADISVINLAITQKEGKADQLFTLVHSKRVEMKRWKFCRILIKSTMNRPAPVRARLNKLFFYGQQSFSEDASDAHIHTAIDAILLRNHRNRL